MPNTFIISDTHFGHEGMCKFLDKHGNKVRPFLTVEEMDEYMVDAWNKTVRPRDKVYHLGDVVIYRRHLCIMDRLNGDKVLIKGNHDIFKISDYLKYFRDVRSVHRLYRSMVLSHVPIHRDCLKIDQVNVHGHTHTNDMMIDGVLDKSYQNVCVEKTQYRPIALEELKLLIDGRA